MLLSVYWPFLIILIKVFSSFVKLDPFTGQSIISCQKNFSNRNTHVFMQSCIFNQNNLRRSSFWLHPLICVHPEILVELSASGLVISDWCAEVNADVSWVPIVMLKVIEPMSSSPSVTCDAKLQPDSSQLELVSSVYFEVEFQDVAWEKVFAWCKHFCMFGWGEDLLRPTIAPGVFGFVQNKCFALFQRLRISQFQVDTAVRPSPELSWYVGSEFGQVTSCNQSHFQYLFSILLGTVGPLFNSISWLSSMEVTVFAFWGSSVIDM